MVVISLILVIFAELAYIMLTSTREDISISGLVCFAICVVVFITIYIIFAVNRLKDIKSAEKEKEKQKSFEEFVKRVKNSKCQSLSSSEERPENKKKKP